MARKFPYASLVGLMLVPLILAGCDLAMPNGGAPIITQGSGAARQCPASFMVQAGDTVYSLARRCGVSVRSLIEINALQPPYSLAPGSLIRMPATLTQIVVVKGDTLSKLAHANHVDFQSFAQANNKAPPYTIRVGEHLRLPGSYDAQPAAAPAVTVIKSDKSDQMTPSQPAMPPSATNRGSAPLPALAMPPPMRPAPGDAKAEEGKPDAPPPVPTERPASEQPAAEEPKQIAAAPPIPEPPPVSSKGFIWPLKGDVLLTFGPQPSKGQNSDGINIAAPKGTPFRAAENGVVAYVGNELKGFGNLILIKHADGWMTAYAHADQVLVKKGQTVKKGQELGTVGQTGAVTQPQLHFEIRRQNEAVDPEEYLQG